MIPRFAQRSTALQSRLPPFEATQLSSGGTKIGSCSPDRMTTSHYFAVVWLLNQWGCRWYLPTDFGEVVPEKPVLSLGELDFAYAPPFEIRHYWLSWNADRTGSDEFRRRNFMTETSLVGMGHSLGSYTSDIAPPGKSTFAVPFSDSRTAAHVAVKN